MDGGHDGMARGATLFDKIAAHLMHAADQRGARQPAGGCGRCHVSEHGADGADVTRRPERAGVIHVVKVLLCILGEP